MSEIARTAGIPVAALIGIVVLIAVQLTLQVAAVISLVKTPAEQVSLGGRKWLWALIIVFTELVGPILWFFLGRTAAPVAESSPVAAARDRAEAAADTLYGAPKDPRAR